ncbi:MAG: hypothetical protein WBN90_00055 [Gammaproteobacteria bacterium]
MEIFSANSAFSDKTKSSEGAVMQLEGFQVFMFRNIIDSGWIDVNNITAFVGQNECGKSNLLQALFMLSPYDKDEKYSIKSDWPIDMWPPGVAEKEVVCKALFSLTWSEIKELFDTAKFIKAAQPEAQDAVKRIQKKNSEIEFPESFDVYVQRRYDNNYLIEFPEGIDPAIDKDKAVKWITQHLPKCVYMDDYTVFAGHADLAALAKKLQKGHAALDEDEKTILVTLELAGIKVEELVGKEGTDEGRTLRGFDTNASSAYLTRRFKHHWKQKTVKFNIRVDGPTLDIHVEDEGLDAYVPLKRRSRGFQWFVSFIWRFTHASEGEFADCILLLDEPGIHLHHAGHRDLLDFFDELSKTNTVIYTTHLSTLLDTAYPERIRIIEVHDHHSLVQNSMISTQKEPMMVIESALGIGGGMSGLLQSRQILIVGSGVDAVILHKLSGIIEHFGENGLADRIFLLPASGVPQTPMYAGFMVGNEWDAGVLLDSDIEGQEAKHKMKAMYLDGLAKDRQKKFRIFMLGDAAGIKQNESAIEDLFPEEFYVQCVCDAYAIKMKPDELPIDGSEQIRKRVEYVLNQRRQARQLDRQLVLDAILRQLDGIEEKIDLPRDTYKKTRKLIDRINQAFA